MKWGLGAIAVVTLGLLSNHTAISPYRTLAPSRKHEHEKHHERSNAKKSPAKNSVTVHDVKVNDNGELKLFDDASK